MSMREMFQDMQIRVMCFICNPWAIHFEGTELDEIRLKSVSS